MEAELPDFRALGTEDLLGLALDGSQQAGGDGPNTLVQQSGTHFVPHEPVGPSNGAMESQDIDFELLRLPVGTGGESQTLQACETPSLADNSAPAAPPAHQRRQPTLVKLSETEELDAELLQLPVGSQELEQNPAALQATGDDFSTGAAAALRPTNPSAANVSESLMDSQAFDDFLRALPVGTANEDDTQPVPWEEAGATDGAPRESIAAAPAAPRAGASAPITAASAAERQGPQPQGPLPQGPPAAPAQGGTTRGGHVAASWDLHDGFGYGDAGGDFENDLEDYLAAQQAEANQAAAPAAASRHTADDDLEDLIAELGYSNEPQQPSRRTASLPEATGGRPGSHQGAAAGRAAAAGSRARPVSTWEQRQPQQHPQQVPQERQMKRQRTEAVHGRPTMEELFGTDDEGEEEPQERYGGKGGIQARAAGAGAVREEAEDEPAASMRAPYFPPQRLAASIQGGLALAVTAASGERVYCRMSEGARAEVNGQAPGRCGALSGRNRVRRAPCLLDKPLSDMLRELEERQLREAVAASEQEGQRLRQQQERFRATGEQHPGGRRGGEPQDSGRATWHSADDVAGAAAGGAATEVPAVGPHGRGARRMSGGMAFDARAGHGLDVEMALWVEKYAPRHFTALLSDERTNRQVALWVKDWDECVFGRQANGAKTSPDGRKADSRPANKVLLIGGPPGLGKTTLAHVVARHCGYNPYEINASDDRTASTLLTKIQDAVQMTAVLGGGRPNCVIVDEVDGATGGNETGGAVAALLKLIRAGEGTAAGGKARGAKGGVGHDDGDEEEGSDDGEDAAWGRKGAGGPKRRVAGGRKGPSQRPLYRPIICICNDLYAPALRPLRDVARVFHFSPPATERLVARLEQICKAEQLDADPAALRLLVERTDRDVRACLNTLQFLARNGGSQGAGRRRLIEAKDIESLNIASKDTTQSAMDMWGMLLSTAAGKGQGARKRGLGAGGGYGGGQLGELCNRLQDFGDYDLILNGVHENLPRVRFLDINLSRTAAAAEAMGLADVLIRSCRRSGDFTAMRFVPPCLAMVRSLAAQPERLRNLGWPRLGAEAARRQSAAAQLVRSWASGGTTDASVLASYGMTAMNLELAPALRALASAPPVRAVAPHMMSVEEQEALRRTAGVMLHYGLRYCFESPTPPGLQPLQLPEVVAPVSSNAIILGLTAEVHQKIASGAAAAGRPGGFPQHQQPPPFGGRGPGGGRGWGTNSYGQGRGAGRDNGQRGGSGGRGQGGGTNSPPSNARFTPPQSAAAATAMVRSVPLVPAIDTLHCFTAFVGGAGGGAKVTVPMVVRQIISQQMEMEAIRRAEMARAAAVGQGSSSQPLCPDPATRAQSPPAPVGGSRPLKPIVPPPQRQMAGRMPPTTNGAKAAAPAGGGTKRKGTWMDAFKQQASTKARGGVGGGTSAGATARNAGQEPEAGLAAGAPGSGERSAGGSRLPFPVLYRFNEGYTNAVKRPLLIRELL